VRHHLATLGVVFLCAVAAAAQVTVVKAGRIVDPDSGTVLTDQVILIRNHKITEVGKGLAVPAGAKVIDLSSMTVLPGLIDCHTHVADGQVGGEPFNVLRKTASQIVLESVTNARKMLESGFTTVRDVGTYRALNDVALRDAIVRGDIPGPRMYVAGAYITITGGAGAMTGQAPDIQLPWDLHYGEANSPWEVRQRIRQLAHDGVDLIKVLSTGAVLTHGSNPSSLEFTPEELNAAVDEASHFGLRVAVHAHAAQGIKNAILAGAASIEHAEMVDDEGIALALKHGTYFDMDIYDEECIQEGGKNGTTPADFLQHDAELGQLQRDNFRKSLKAGVKMAFGTDAGVCPYGTSGKQFAFMVKYGMTPMQAIQAATTNAADLLGHSKDVGSIKPGKFADLIAVSRDPLQDVSVLENVEFVMKDGAVYKSPKTAACSAQSNGAY
jgi:imidazolonepropionase-like amidohydrolase